jgi:hypothetical protein
MGYHVISRLGPVKPGSLSVSREPFPYHSGAHLIAAVELFTFADESGIQGGAPYCIISGYIASPRQWLSFEAAWQRVLAEFDVPYFHSKEFFNRSQGHGVYKHLSSAEAMRFLRALLATMQTHRLSPIGGAVDVQAFDALTLGERRFLTGGNFTESGRWLSSGAPSKPYYLGLQHFVVEALMVAKPHTKVHLVFDRQHVLSARAVQTLQEIVSLPPESPWRETHHLDLSRISSMQFANSTEEPALQLADLHTHAWYSYFSRGALGIEREVAMKEVSKKRNGMRMNNAEGFNILLARIPPDLRQRLQAATAKGKRF